MLDWEKAEKHLKWAEETYAGLGSVGYFALVHVIRPLRDRFNKGERSEDLYKAITSLE